MEFMNSEITCNRTSEVILNVFLCGCRRNINFVADATSFSKTFCFCSTYHVYVMFGHDMLDRFWATRLLPIKENAIRSLQG